MYHIMKFLIFLYCFVISWVLCTLCICMYSCGHTINSVVGPALQSDRYIKLVLDVMYYRFYSKYSVLLRT